MKTDSTISISYSFLLVPDEAIGECRGCQDKILRNGFRLVVFTTVRGRDLVGEFRETKELICQSCAPVVQERIEII